MSLTPNPVDDRQIEIYYLHGPDRTTPYEETLKGVNDLYKEGKFKVFGLSNFMACVFSLSSAACFHWALMGLSV